MPYRTKATPCGSLSNGMKRPAQTTARLAVAALVAGIAGSPGCGGEESPAEDPSGADALEDTAPDAPFDDLVPTELPTDSPDEDAVDTSPPPGIQPGEHVIEEPVTCLRNGAPGVFTESAGALGITFVHDAKPTVPFGPSAELAVGAGVAVADLDGDGALDLYFANTGGPDALYRTAGNGPLQFTLATLPTLGPTPRVGVYAADPDRDGDMDLLTSPPDSGAGLLLNDGSGVFTSIGGLTTAPPAGGFEAAVAWADMNGDGRLDIVIAGGPADAPSGPVGSPDRLFLGEAPTSYAEVPMPQHAVHGQAFIAAPIDLDDDGDLDIYIVNDLGMDLHPNRLLRNEGGGSFKDVSFESDADVAVWGMGLAVGDVDNDGRLDLYVTSMSPIDDVLLHNDGDSGKFSDWTFDWKASSTQIADGVAWGAIFIDTDSDGDEDLFVTHGFHHDLDDPDEPEQLEQTNVLLINTGSGMENGTVAAGLGGTRSSRSPVEADLDGDGFPDLIVGNVGASPYVYLNGCDEERAWIGLRFARLNGSADAIGVRVRVEAAGRVFVRELGSGNDGLYGSGPPELTIGLGAAEKVEALVIRWPSNGAIQTLTDLPVRRWITVAEPNP